MKRYKLGSKGFSLAELAVTAGILGILTLAATGLGINTLQLIKKNEADGDLASLNALIRLHLSKPGACPETLGKNIRYDLSNGRTAESGATASQLKTSAKTEQDFTNVFDIRDRFGNVSLPVRSGLGGSSIGTRYSLQSAIFRVVGEPDFAITASDGVNTVIVNQFTGNMELTYQTATGNVLRSPFRIPMSIREQSGGTMFDCSVSVDNTNAQIVDRPLYSCMFGGSYLDAGNAADNIVNPFTGDFSCPGGFLPYPSGAYNVPKAQGKYGTILVQHTTFQCLKCPAGHVPPVIDTSAGPAKQPVGVQYNPTTDQVDACAASGGCGT